MVTRFTIHAVFHEYLGGRCFHNRGERNYDGVSETSEELIPLLKQLKPGALRSFWYSSLEEYPGSS